jgi:pyruvate kinase
MLLDRDTTLLPDLTDPDALLAALLDLRQAVYEEGQQTFAEWRPRIQRQRFLSGALNLAYYLALRRRDLRPLQAALIPWGLSSLGRLENRVIPNLDAVLTTLGVLCKIPPPGLPPRPRLSLFGRGERLLRHSTRAIFGPEPTGRRVHIMVTMPSEAADDYGLVRDLLARGMDCIRINCAHDTPDEWERMIAHLRRAELETGRPCKVAMDLGGPKVRTETVFSPLEGRLRVGDKLLIVPGEPHYSTAYPYQASCTLREIFEQVRVGQRVFIDDGKLGAVIESVEAEGLALRVTAARAQGERLKPYKGLNFPDTDLNIPALTGKDIADLDFVAANADIVNYSFVQEAADVTRLQDELDARTPSGKRLSIVLKVETQRAIYNLPEMMVTAAGRNPMAVMIARGDLAVEIGYQRMAEMQEQILWLCEAASVPVIWATQVLEQLVKKGRPSRAEMSDAAMAERAECVMLNKGTYIRDAVSILDDVLRRMSDHQLKKTARLRALRSW